MCIRDSSRHLTNLHLNLNGCFYVTDECLQILGDAISKCSFLTHLNLNLSSLREITDSGVSCITNGLPSLSQLTLLYLSFSFCEKLTDRSVESIIISVLALSKVTHLLLGLNNRGFSNAFFLSLINFLRSLSGKNEISIGWRCNSDEEGCLMNNAISSSTSPSQLQIDYTSSKITDVTLKSIATTIRPFTTLLHLEFNWWNVKGITDEGIIAVSEQLSQLARLISFKGYFAGTQLSDEGVTHLMNAIQPLQHLSCLHLYMSLCRKISDAGVDKILSLLQSRASIVDITFKLDSTGITFTGYEKLLLLESTRQFVNFEVKG
eukprot:TRINITY_DN20135_c0_g1_i1.p1 TRINITY_DN20135_c0_g1~~TRINITY_DN20135_c0_g1_i1.p1  ORF type:complete len:339 (-),score=58.09 TRINITY_DN20135_c0_g1_i1:130-1089(-)